MISLKQDDLAVQFTNRMTLDACQPNLTYSYAANGLSIVSVTVTALGNACSVPIPVQIQASATTAAVHTTEQLGSDPLKSWTTWCGTPVTITLQSLWFCRGEMM